MKDVPIRFRRKDGKIVPVLIDSNVNYQVGLCRLTHVFASTA